MKNLDPVLQLLKLDKRLGTIVLAAIALISVAAIFATAFEEQSKNISPFIVILYLLGFVLILYLIKSIVNNGAMKTVLSWFIVVFMVIYICVIFFSVLFPGTVLPPSHCIIQFWEDNAACKAPVLKVKTPEVPKMVWKDIPAGYRIVTLGSNSIPIYTDADTSATQVGSLVPNVMYPELSDFAIRRGNEGGVIWYEVVNNDDGKIVYIPGAQVTCLDDNNNQC